MPINQNFATWARSLAGCDGGDIKKSDVWVCGIEWGWGKGKNESQEEYEAKLLNYYSVDLLKDMAGEGKPPAVEYDILKETGYQFGLKLAKLYAVVRGRNTSDYVDVARAGSGSEIFKMNLYPIAFPDTKQDYWSEYGLHEKVGIATRDLYLAWCRVHRFPFFAELVGKHRPKLIIGTGAGYLADFMLAFGGEIGLTDMERVQVIPDSSKNGRARDISIATIGDSTTLVVTPFFGGQYGLNSDHLIGEVGRAILKRRPELGYTTG